MAILAHTGPTIFNPEIKSLVEDYFGAIPLYVNQDKEEGLNWVLDQIDGLILAGGNDIFPQTYNEEITNRDSLTKFDRARDIRELYLIKQCFERNIPILGICRGHQILGIYHDLHLVKDITGSEVCHSPNKSGIELDGLPCHKVNVVNKHQATFFNEEWINSFHHQALWYVDSPKAAAHYENKGIDIIGYSHLRYKSGNNEAQKIIELMQGINNRWISMQWHAEAAPEEKANKIVLDKFGEMLK